MNMAEHCFEGEVVHGSMMANNQDRNRKMREMDKKSIDGWCMKQEGEMDEKQNGHAFDVHEQWQ